MGFFTLSVSRHRTYHPESFWSRCLIIPPFVYSTGEDFEEGEVTDPSVEARVRELAKELNRICMALNKQP